eukprot:TRINITY_DN31720_c0_g1_i1.p1 TRINITY_DN31720_c0_g1~~TRINITY_DN31720_c0_g1_i1.p1  ORF type:complete len:298 (+),score=51.37 TRINITY_DN31720_c0_g1_i1:80-895(+)
MAGLTLWVRIIGTDAAPVQVEVPPDADVAALVAAASAVAGCAPSSHQIIWQGRSLPPGALLADEGVSAQSTLDLAPLPLTWDPQVQTKWISYSDDAKTGTYKAGAPDWCYLVSSRPVDNNCPQYFEFTVHGLNDEMWMGITDDRDPQSMETCVKPQEAWVYYSSHMMKSQGQQGSLQSGPGWGSRRTRASHKSVSPYGAGDVVGLYVDLRGNGVAQFWLREAGASETVRQGPALELSTWRSRGQPMWVCCELDATGDSVTLQQCDPTGRAP